MKLTEVFVLPKDMPMVDKVIIRALFIGTVLEVLFISYGVTAIILHYIGS